MQNYIIFGLAAVVVVFFVWKILFKSKNKGDSSFWKGKVKSKESKPDDSFFVTVITTENKKVVAKISKILWNNLNNDDVIEKRKGDLYPRKV